MRQQPQSSKKENLADSSRGRPGWPGKRRKRKRAVTNRVAETSISSVWALSKDHFSRIVLGCLQSILQILLLFESCIHPFPARSCRIETRASLPFRPVPRPHPAIFQPITHRRQPLSSNHTPAPISQRGRPVLYSGQAYGRAYGTGRSHARSPCLQHRPQLAGGVAPEPPFIT